MGTPGTRSATEPVAPIATRARRIMKQKRRCSRLSHPNEDVSRPPFRSIHSEDQRVDIRESNILEITLYVGIWWGVPSQYPDSSGNTGHRRARSVSFIPRRSYDGIGRASAPFAEHGRDDRNDRSEHGAGRCQASTHRRRVGSLPSSTRQEISIERRNAARSLAAAISRVVSPPPRTKRTPIPMYFSIKPWS